LAQTVENVSLDAKDCTTYLDNPRNGQPAVFSSIDQSILLVDWNPGEPNRASNEAVMREYLLQTIIVDM